jgi:ribosomal protein S6--L-glutamate ligase
MGFRMLLGRGDERTCSCRSRKQYLLGQPTSESLKELYQNSEKTWTSYWCFSNPELYSNKRIMEAGEMRGHAFFEYQRIYMRCGNS